MIPAATSHLIPMGAVNWNNPATGATQTDIYTADTTGNLWDYQRMPSGILVGSGWCGFTPFGIEDWYGTGYLGVVAWENATNLLWFYPGDMTGGNGNPTQIGSGWTTGAYDPFGIIDFNGDGHTDILTRYEPTDILKLYVGNGTGGGYPTNGTQIGAGENEDTFFGMLYYNNSTTEPDMIVRSDTGSTLGNLELIKGNGTGGWTDGNIDQILANGW